MDNNKYGLYVTRIRVDLGSDIFVDGEIPVEPILEAPTREKLLEKAKKFILDRNGEVVEENGSEIVFDTTDLTITAVMRKIE